MKTHRIQFFICIVFVVFNLTNTLAQPLHDLTFRLLDIHGSNQAERDTIQKFWKDMKLLVSSENKQRSFKGSPTFSYNGNQSNSQNLHEIKGGITVTRGLYPSQFTFSTDFNLTYNNNKVKENLTNIYIAYDHHPRHRKGDPLGVEYFTFLSRFTDAYLGVEQRYELGLGSIIAHWSKKPKGGYTKDGIAEFNKVKKLSYVLNILTTRTTNTDPPTIDTSPSYAPTPVIKIFNNHLKLLNRDTLTDKDIENMNDERKNLLQTIRKNHAKLRVGILYGFFIEAENINFKDSLNVYDSLLVSQGRQEIPVDFDPTVRLRWELRPIIYLQPNDTWLFKLRPYVKLPMPWDWNSNVRYTSPLTDSLLSDKRFDFRVDVEATAEIKLVEFKDTNSKIKLELKYNLYYDHAPRRVYLKDKYDMNGNNLLFKAPSLHQVYNFGVKFDF